MSSNLGKAFISQLSKETDHKSLIHICEEMFPIIKEVAKNKNGFEKAMDLLLHLEKLTRNAKHYESNAQVLIEIASLCVETNHWRDLNDYLVILSNRKSFIEKSVVALIKHCLMIIRSIKIEKIIQLELMKVLYGITKGKNYLELERAKLSKVMADHYEEENNVGKAIEILEDLKCETISNLDNREKIKFQLQLIRLFIAKENYMKAQNLSAKISKKFLEESDQEDLKLDYYSLKIILDSKENFFVTSKHYQSILNCYNDDDPMKLHTLTMAILYCILAPNDYEQEQCMENLLRNKLMEVIPKLMLLLKLFLTKEIINLNSFLRIFKNDLCKYEILNEKTEIGKHNWLEINNRLMEHNIFVISLYYERIYIKRMSEILCITIEKCENLISKLISNGRILAKIDRLTGVINFNKVKRTGQILNDWIFNINELTIKVNNSFHDVNKMQY